MERIPDYLSPGKNVPLYPLDNLGSVAQVVGNHLQLHENSYYSCYSH